ncbi:MAG TPA: hypothetical protein VF845_06750 [Terriglobales bacterium]
MMKMRVILPMFWLLCLPVVAWTQTKDADQPKITITKINGTVPASDAHIVKYYVDDRTPGSDYETGSLHIIYSDKTELVEKLPPKQKSTEDNVVFNEVGITDPKLADDKRTIAWTEQFENCCTSYSIPLVLAIYCSGKNIVEIQQGQMVWNWMFVGGGKRVAAVWGAVHLSEIGDYQLYDPETGHMIEEIIGDKEIEGKDGTVHGVGPDAPAWAKELEKHQNGG